MLPRYDVEISIVVRFDVIHWQKITISCPDHDDKDLNSIWEELLYQINESKHMLEKEIEEEKCQGNNS